MRKMQISEDIRESISELLSVATEEGYLGEISAMMSGGPDQVNAVCDTFLCAQVGFYPNDQVWWDDPGGGTCSKAGVVADVVSEEMVKLEDSTECLPSELTLINSERNPRRTPLTATEVRDRTGVNNEWIEDVFVVDVVDMLNCKDSESRLDLLSQVAVGGPQLTEISYQIVGVDDRDLLVRIGGYVDYAYYEGK